MVLVRYTLSRLDNGDFEARCCQYDHLFTIAETASDALEEIQDLVEAEVDDHNLGWSIESWDASFDGEDDYGY